MASAPALALANDVQLLIGSEPKPRARKREGRTRHGLEPQDLAIKLATLLHVADVNRDVVQFLNLHGNLFAGSDKPRLHRDCATEELRPSI